MILMLISPMLSLPHLFCWLFSCFSAEVTEPINHLKFELTIDYPIALYDFMQNARVISSVLAFIKTKKI